MPPVGFESTISAGERPQTNALDRAATGIGSDILWNTIKDTRNNAHVFIIMRWDNSVGIMSRLRIKQPRDRGSIAGKARSPPPKTSTPAPASSQLPVLWVPSAFFPEGKAATNTQLVLGVENEWRCTSTLLIRVRGVYRDSFTLLCHACCRGNNLQALEMHTHVACCGRTFGR